MTELKSIAPLTWALLIVTPLIIAVGQVLFKLTSDKLMTDQAPLYSIAFNPVFIAAVALYGGATLLWVYVMRAAPLVYVHSFMALTFIFVPILAYLWLGDTLSLKYGLGLLLIIAGIMVVQSS